MQFLRTTIPIQGDAYSIRKIINKSGQTLEEWFPEYAEPRNRFTSYKI